MDVLQPCSSRGLEGHLMAPAWLKGVEIVWPYSLEFFVSTETNKQRHIGTGKDLEKNQVKSKPT